MGTVWRGEDVRLHGRPCAIKALSVTDLGGLEAVEAMAWFDREIEVLSRLRHPAICDVRDAVSDGDHRYLILELIEGHTLAEELVLRGAPGLPPAYVVRWGATLGDALAYLHGQQPPIVFRDLKPANIMLRPDGQVMLIDFGIARPLARAGATAIGTGGYAPPEQYQGLAEPRSDIYGLAATLHHLLTGRDPTVQIPFTFPSLRSLGLDLPPQLDATLGRALSMRPEDRHPDIGAFVAALAVTLQPNSTAGRAKRTSALAHGASLGVSSLLIRRASTVSDPARSFVLGPTYTVERRNKPRDHPLPGGLVMLDDDHLWVMSEAALWDLRSEQITWEVGVTSDERAALSGDGQHLAQYLSGRLVIWRAFQPTPMKLDGPPGSGMAEFSPDGTLLAAISEERASDVTCWDVDTGEVALRFQGHSQELCTFLWSMDGSTVVTSAYDRTLRLWDTASGLTRHRLKGFDEPPDLLTFNPSGDLLACVAGSRKDPYAIRLWDTGTGKELNRLRDHHALVNGLAFSPDGAMLASWGDDGVVNLWPIDDGAPEWSLEGHDGAVLDAVFSPAGDLLASAGEDGTIVLWDIETGRQLHVLQESNGVPVVRVLFRPSGRGLVSLGEDDDLVRVWQI